MANTGTTKIRHESNQKKKKNNCRNHFMIINTFYS